MNIFQLTTVNPHSVMYLVSWEGYGEADNTWYFPLVLSSARMCVELSHGLSSLVGLMISRLCLCPYLCLHIYMYIGACMYATTYFVTSSIQSWFGIDLLASMQRCSRRMHYTHTHMYIYTQPHTDMQTDRPAQTLP